MSEVEEAEMVLVVLRLGAIADVSTIGLRDVASTKAARPKRNRYRNKCIFCLISAYEVQLFSEVKDKRQEESRRQDNG